MPFSIQSLQVSMSVMTTPTGDDCNSPLKMLNQLGRFRSGLVLVRRRFVHSLSEYLRPVADGTLVNKDLTKPGDDRRTTRFSVVRTNSCTRTCNSGQWMNESGPSGSHRVSYTSTNVWSFQMCAEKDWSNATSFSDLSCTTSEHILGMRCNSATRLHDTRDLREWL